MNKKTIFLSIIIFQMVFLLIWAPVFSEDELPVEIDIELIYETMSLEQALNRFKEDADSGRISVAQIDTAGNAIFCSRCLSYNALAELSSAERNMNPTHLSRWK